MNTFLVFGVLFLIVLSHRVSICSSFASVRGRYYRGANNFHCFHPVTNRTSNAVALLVSETDKERSIHFNNAAGEVSSLLQVHVGQDHRQLLEQDNDEEDEGDDEDEDEDDEDQADSNTGKNSNDREEDNRLQLKDFVISLAMHDCQEVFANRILRALPHMARLANLYGERLATSLDRRIIFWMDHFSRTSHEKSHVKTYQRASSSVVRIQTVHYLTAYIITKRKKWPWSRHEPPEITFEVPSAAKIKKRNQVKEIEVSREAGGTGVLWSKDGYIVTNHHILYTENGVAADVIQVKLEGAGGVHFTNATIVGSCCQRDIAVLKIPITQYMKDSRAILGFDAMHCIHAPKMGCSRNLQVGQSCLSIGFPKGGSCTLTNGVISCLNEHRTSDFDRNLGCINHDAAHAPGSSGGPLLDSRGRLIGIHVGSLNHVDVAGIGGMAIPIDTVQRIATQIIQYGKTITPKLGVHVMSNRFWGARLLVVEPGSPAEEAGLQNFRLSSIVKADGKAVREVEDLTTILDSKFPGDKIHLTLFHPRKGFATVPVKVGSEDFKNSTSIDADGIESLLDYL